MLSMLLNILILANSIELENKSKATQMRSLIVFVWIKIPSAIDLLSPWWGAISHLTNSNNCIILHTDYMHLYILRFS